MPGQTLCQNRQSRALGLLQTRSEKNKTIWLILNDCLPDRGAGCQLCFFSSRVKQPAWAPVGSVLLNETLLSAGIFFYLSLTPLHCLCSNWTLHSLNDPSSALKPEKRADKTKLWRECCGVGWCQSLRRVEKPVYMFDLICLISLNERSTLRGFSWVLSSEIKAV